MTTIQEPPDSRTLAPRNRPKIPAWLRLAVYERDGYACVTCGWQPQAPPAGWAGRTALAAPPVPLISRGTVLWVASCLWLELDHIVPWSLGGPTALANLQAMCSPDNRAKAAGLLACASGR